VESLKGPPTELPERFDFMLRPRLQPAPPLVGASHIKDIPCDIPSEMSAAGAGHRWHHEEWTQAIAPANLQNHHQLALSHNKGDRSHSLVPLEVEVASLVADFGAGQTSLGDCGVHADRELERRFLAYNSALYTRCVIA
jgi:hypothetical protein